MQEMMLNKTYDPGQVEEKIYEMWMDSYFRAETDENK